MGLYAWKAPCSELTLGCSTAWLILTAGSWMAVRAQTVRAAAQSAKPYRDSDRRMADGAELAQHLERVLDRDAYPDVATTEPLARR
jgi:hypothetical protein